MPDTTSKNREVVLLASGDPSVSGHFANILGKRYPVVMATDSAEMLKLISSARPAVLVIDPILFQEAVTDQIAAVSRMAPGTHVVVVENSSERDVDQHALFKAGIHGFCRDDISEVLLLKAIQLVLDGDYWVQRKLVTQVIADIAAERISAQGSSNFDRSLVNSLTPRELQVARMVHMGGNNKSIARELDISERTVKAHLSAIFRKLEIENRLNLALYFSEIT